MTQHCAPISKNAPLNWVLSVLRHVLRTCSISNIFLVKISLITIWWGSAALYSYPRRTNWSYVRFTLDSNSKSLASLNTNHVYWIGFIMHLYEISATDSYLHFQFSICWWSSFLSSTGLSAGSEKSLKNDLRSDFSICSSLWIQVVLYLAALKCCATVKVGMKASIL